MKKIIEKIVKTLGAGGFAIGFGCCAVISLGVFAYTWFVMPALSMLFMLVYAVLFLPYVFFGAMLTRKLVLGSFLKNNPALRFASKAASIALIWFIVFFPFSMFGVQALLNMPSQLAEKREMDVFRKEVQNAETYADLSLLGLGIYKRVNEGDQYIWDITQPKKNPNRFEGTLLIFEHSNNVRDRENWEGDDQKKDLVYNVCQYGGTWIIVPISPYNYAYLCEEISEDVDMFLLLAIGSEAKEKLLELPAEQYSRQEIAKLLGKE
ncbi:MAG: hypothetical protein FWG10_08525 [Eubacteriaceae bacterium]|nr:hypothetical protein [Eubacteriaceae bacterium]